MQALGARYMAEAGGEIAERRSQKKELETKWPGLGFRVVDFQGSGLRTS